MLKNNTNVHNGLCIASKTTQNPVATQGNYNQCWPIGHYVGVYIMQGWVLSSWMATQANILKYKVNEFLTLRWKLIQI